MKKLLIGLLALGSLSVFASECSFTCSMDSKGGYTQLDMEPFGSSHSCLVQVDDKLIQVKSIHDYETKISIKDISRSMDVSSVSPASLGKFTLSAFEVEIKCYK